jgi:ankyrin repeat protein
MLAYGADLELDHLVSSPLMLAARSGNLPLLRRLLSPETVNMRDEGGVPLLLHACHRGKAECIEYLLSLGASIDDTDAHVLPPILIRVPCLAWPCRAWYLISEVSKLQDSTALMHAAMGNNDKLIDWLIDVKKVDMDLQNWDDMAAINFAVRYGNLDAATALLKHGANLLDPPADEMTVDTLPLAQACRSKSVDMVHLLLDHGFSFDDPIARRYCLQACVASNSVDMCRFVLDQLDELDAGPLKREHKVKDDEDDEDGVDDEDVDELPLTNAVLDALADNHTVARLNLRGHSLAGVGLPQLLIMLARNQHLAHLDLRDISITLDEAERFVANLRAFNRSLLTLELDVDALPLTIYGAPPEDECSGTPTADVRRKRLWQAIDEMAVRALSHRRKVATAAIHMLVAARVLLRGDTTQYDDEDSQQQQEVVRLPLEVLEAIVARVDTERMLGDWERRRVMAFASRGMAATRGSTREQFLRECIVSLTWWPPQHSDRPARERDSDITDDTEEDQQTKQTKKAKPCPASE